MVSRSGGEGGEPGETESAGGAPFDEAMPLVHTVDCALDRLAPVSVSDFSLTRDP
jgi:hypothetical protein